ncbi:MAG TPA: hypothetical protein VG944_02455 [Fimbriimonas sp.]|nr:hypothetical protein [Fimbriimonas sp.]
MKPDSVAKDLVKQVADALKCTATIENQGRAFDGSTYPYWIAYKVEVSGTPCEAYCQVICLGLDSLVENAILVAPSNEENALAQNLLNTCRIVGSN